MGGVLKLWGGGILCLVLFSLLIDWLSRLYPPMQSDVGLGLSLSFVWGLFALALLLAGVLMRCLRRAYLDFLPLCLPLYGLSELLAYYPHRAIAFAFVCLGLYLSFVCWGRSIGKPSTH